MTARQVPIITVATDFQDGKYNFIDREPLFSVSVAMVESDKLRGNFIVDSQITIFELKNNLLERLTAQPGTDYMFGTLQGPLYDSNWLSEYMAHVLYAVSAQIAARLRQGKNIRVKHVHYWIRQLQERQYSPSRQIVTPTRFPWPTAH